MLIESRASGEEVKIAVGVPVGEGLGELARAVGLDSDVKTGDGVGELTCGEGITSTRGGIHAHKNAKASSKT
jgi:hypothetical protein